MQVQASNRLVKERDSTIAALETRVQTGDAQIMVTTNNLNKTKKQLAEALTAVEGAESRARVAEKVVDNDRRARLQEKTQLKSLTTKIHDFSTKSEELLVKVESEKSANKDLENKVVAANAERDAALSRVSSFDSREADLVRKLSVMDDVRRKLHNRVMQLTGNIRVFVRVRPTLPYEQVEMDAIVAKARRGDPAPEIPFNFPGLCDTAEGIDSTKRLVEMQVRGGSERAAYDPTHDPTHDPFPFSAWPLTRHSFVKEPWKDRGGLNPRRKQWRFGFDSVFSPTDDQKIVWEAAEPLVQSAVDGANVCLFAYGQTGSGKTHTMLGDEQSKGLIFRAVDKVFESKRAMEDGKESEYNVELRVEMLEIYNEKVSTDTHLRRPFKFPSNPLSSQVNDLLNKDGKDLVVNDNEVVGSTRVAVRKQITGRAKRAERHVQNAQRAAQTDRLSTRTLVHSC